jgi:hypothetical protein
MTNLLFILLRANRAERYGLLTNSPSRPSTSGNLSVIAPNPSRKCDGASKQSPGGIRMPLSAAAWQKARQFSPLRSQGNAVIPPRGGTQPSVAQCSVMKTWRYRRFRAAVSCVFDFVYVSSYLSSRKGLNCISHLERLDQQRFSLGSQILISFCASDMKRGSFRRRFQRPRRDNAVIYPLVAS